MRKTTRESDTVARLGGDEFALMFETQDASHAVEVARRTGRALESSFALGGVSIDVRASMGIAVYPLHADDAGTLMKRADVAMYDAKRSQQAFAVYESVRDEHSLRRLAILSELRQAIASDELEVHYQPKIDFATERAVHAEAVTLAPFRPRHDAARRVHPPRGAVGTSAMITKWVAAQGARRLRPVDASGLDLVVAGEPLGPRPLRLELPP